MASDEGIKLLRSIDATLKALLALSQRRTPAAPKEIASNRDLDGKYGDPLVKFNPRDWAKDSFKGCNMSQCPAEFLDMVAETFDYFAEKAERTNELTTSRKPKAPYSRRDAARARGWAKRIREGWRAPAMQASESDEWGGDAESDEWPSADDVFGGEVAR